MSEQFELSLTPPILPAVCYFIVSIVIFFLLYLGKLKVNRLHKYPLFIAYTLFVIAIAAIQINVLPTAMSLLAVFYILILILAVRLGVLGVIDIRHALPAGNAGIGINVANLLCDYS
jgi:hypothetical protein